MKNIGLIVVGAMFLIIGSSGIGSCIRDNDWGMEFFMVTLTCFAGLSMFLIGTIACGVKLGNEKSE
jgi:hypothetical protein